MKQTIIPMELTTEQLEVLAAKKISTETWRQVSLVLQMILLTPNPTVDDQTHMLELCDLVLQKVGIECQILLCSLIWHSTPIRKVLFDLDI